MSQRLKITQIITLKTAIAHTIDILEHAVKLLQGILICIQTIKQNTTGCNFANSDASVITKKSSVTTTNVCKPDFSGWR